MSDEEESNNVPKHNSEYVVNEMTDVCGSFGPFQRTVFIFSMMVSFPAAWHNLGITFFGFDSDHWCARPSRFENLTVDQWKSLAIPKDHTAYSQCAMYDMQHFTNTSEWFASNKTTVPCKSWEFDTSIFTTTIVSKWQLVCGDAWMVSLTQSLYMAGFLTAVSVCGQLGDKFGRRPIALFCMSVMQAAGVAMAFSTSFTFYAITRYFIGLGAAGLFTTYFVILMEVCGPDKRPILGIVFGACWAAGLSTLALFAYFIRDWFTLQLTVTIPGFVIFLSWWLMPESPRWLLSQGRLDEARKLLEKAADMNGMSCAQIYVQSEAFFRGVEKSQKLASREDKPKRANVLDLLKTPNMRKKTIIICLCWFVVAFIYYGLSLNTSDLGGDPFINFFISAVVEFPAMLGAYYVIVYLGRRKPMAGMYIIGGIACLFTIPVTDDLIWLRVTLAMTGKMFIAAAFATVYIYSAEIYPTVVRNVGVGASSTCARFGSIIAPFVKELSHATGLEVPLAIFGVMSFLCGLLAFLLPETHNLPVPDTMEEGENFGKKQKTNTEELTNVELGNTNMGAQVQDSRST